MGLRNPAISGVASRLGRDPGVAFDRAMPRRPASVEVAAPAPRKIGFWRMAFIGSATLLAMAGAILTAAWLLGAQLARGGHSADRSLREVVIGNDVLAVPANAIRFPGQRRNGDSDRVDIYLRWPDLSGYVEEAKEDFSSAAVNPALLFLSIEPRVMSQDMTGRIGPIYSKFMTGPELDAAPGLKRRSIAGEGGFPGEELWYEPASPYPYAARCMAAGDGGGAPYCLRDFHAGRDLAVTYRFHQSLAGEWMAIERSVRAEIKRWLRQ